MEGRRHPRTVGAARAHRKWRGRHSPARVCTACCAAIWTLRGAGGRIPVSEGGRGEEVADILGTTSRTLQRWREQGTTPLRENAERVEKLDELRFWLEAVFEGDWEGARSWLSTRVIDLRGKAPMELIRRRRLDKVIELLATAYEGAFI